MTDAERIEYRRWSAEDLLGWKFFSGLYYYRYDPEESLIHCPGWTRHIKKDDWAPDRDSSPAWQIDVVIKEMGKSGWFLTLKYEGRRYRANFWTLDSCGLRKTANSGKDEVLGSAILIAARAAWESAQGEPTRGDQEPTRKGKEG